MHKSVEGIFRSGKIELLEPAPTEQESRVVVTFMSNSIRVDLGERGIDQAQAADLRARLNPITKDWDRSDMDIYDEL